MRKYSSEFIGTFLLLNSIVGSGIMASNLTKDAGLQLLINALAAVAMLAVIISIFGETSGAHFNPAVSLFFLLGKRLNFREFVGYVGAQVLGAILGTLFSNLMFNREVLEISTQSRISSGTFIAEVIATFGLIMVIRTKPERAAILVPTWIGTSYFYTSSTSFANPAVTIGRIFTSSYSGIAPASVLPYILAQLLGTCVLMILASLFFKEKA